MMNSDTQELRTEFEGKGEVKGYKFKQIMINPDGYLYEVSHPDCIDAYFEVFIRMVHRPENREIHPNSCDKTAWTFKDLVKAIEKFESFAKAED